MDRFQLRRDSLERWESENPILLEGEIGLVLDTKSFKIGDGIHNWNDLDYSSDPTIVQDTGISESAIMSQKAVSWKFLADKSFSGRVSIDPNMLVDITAESAYNGYKKSDRYDAAWFQVMEDSGTISVTGATVRLMACFSSLEPVADSYIGTIFNNQTILAGTKLIIIDLERVNNEGKYPAYVDLVVTTDSTGATRKQVTDVEDEVEVIRISNGINDQLLGTEMLRNSCVRQSFITNIDYTTEHADGYYNTNIKGIRSNPNYNSYEYDMTSYVGKFLHFKTLSSGTMWGIVFLDANDNILTQLYQSFSTGEGTPFSNAIDNDVLVPWGAARVFVNWAKSTAYPVSVYYDSGERTSCRYDIVPVNLKVRDLATRIGEPVVMLNHLIQLGGTGAGPNGNIIPSNNKAFDIAFLKLNPETVSPVRLECNYPVYYWCWYRTDEINATNYIGANKTGITLAGATYCVLLFKTSEIANKQGYNNLRVYNQKGTLIDHDFALRKLTYTSLPSVETISGSWINPRGTVSTNQYFRYVRFDIPDIGQDYALTSSIGSNTSLYLLNFYDAENNFLSNLFYVESPSGCPLVQKKNTPFKCPVGTAYVLVNCRIQAPEQEPSVSIINCGDYYNLQSLYSDDKLMKVHVYNVIGKNGNNLFYVRTKYNEAKDIIMLYYTNNNGLISPNAAYIGANTLPDNQIMTSTYSVSSHGDSTAPLFTMKEYWHLFAQHGYVIPTLANSVNMTSADVGALWQDQLCRQYNIGSVTTSTIQLLPVVTRGSVEGTDSRSWKDPTGPAITSLTHVSGGVVTTPITTVTSLATTQLRPIMKSYNRKMIADGMNITESGDYYCDEFQVSESQIGYDPAWVDTWYPTPVLTGVPEMARFTWSYNFKGATCGVNTTIDIRRKVEAASYGATQQQTFFDKGDYKAMFLIPKAAAQAGVELDKPFNSPLSSSRTYMFYRNSSYLKDIDKPIDRLIGYLYNPSTNDYLVGMAAGLSIVSGDTIPEKRNINIPVASNTSDRHNRLGSFSPSNTNKFYIAAVNSSPFADDNYNFPNTYFKEINYYVSYFDPSENIGQVYWYKDGSDYVIYAHCQSIQDRIPLKLPLFMEGLNVEIVEKTDGTTLHTNTIQNGNLFVSYTDEANYIVLKTK